MAILHCVPDDDDPGAIVGSLLAACPPGSFLALSHPARDQVAVAVRAETSLTKPVGQKVTFRTREQVAGFASGLDLVEPGVVPVQEQSAGKGPATIPAPHKPAPASLRS